MQHSRWQHVWAEDEVGPLPHRPMIPPLKPPPQEPLEPNSPQPMIYLPVQQRWQYKIVTYPQTEASVPTEADLNTLGEQGWELTGVLPAGDSTHFYFKRLQR